MTAGPDAAPARRFRKPAPGRPRVAVRAHYEGLPERAGRGTDEGERKPAGSGCAESRPGPRPEARPRGRNRRQWSAERRPHIDEMCGKTEDWCATRRSAPSLVEVRKRKAGLPGAARTGAMML